MTTAQVDRSYRALLAVPALGRVVLGMQLARIAQSMVGVAIVLFALSVYHSPVLAGIVAFASSAPGMLASPLAGALLDRHGRTRLVMLDYLLAALSLVTIALLSTGGMLPAWLLVAIAAAASLTGPLSTTGLRSLFPLMVPRHLWERVNALDSSGYVVATIVGPPVAGVLLQVIGPEPALAAIGALFVVAAMVLLRIPDPRTSVASTGSLLLDAWQGIVYTWRNTTLRALGFSLTTTNIGNGIMYIAIPLLVLGRLHGGPAAVGLAFALQGIGGVIAAVAFGRMDTRGRERQLLYLPMLGMAAVLLLLLPDWGVLPFALVMLVLGVLNGPIDISLFTIRQRRTDPAWLGRAFAISMAFNALGVPVGAALAGSLANWSLEGAIVIAIVAALAGAFIARRFIPATDDSAGITGATTMAQEGTPAPT